MFGFFFVFKKYIISLNLHSYIVCSVWSVYFVCLILVLWLVGGQCAKIDFSKRQKTLYYTTTIGWFLYFIQILQDVCDVCCRLNNSNIEQFSALRLNCFFFANYTNINTFSVNSSLDVQIKFHQIVHIWRLCF